MSLLRRFALLSPSAVKTWPLPHSSSLTPTQDLSHCCFHDNTNAETAGWDAQQDKANRYQGEGCIMSRIHRGPYTACDGQITRRGPITDISTRKEATWFLVRLFAAVLSRGRSSGKHSTLFNINNNFTIVQEIICRSERGYWYFGKSI